MQRRVPRGILLPRCNRWCSACVAVGGGLHGSHCAACLLNLNVCLVALPRCNRWCYAAVVAHAYVGYGGERSLNCGACVQTAGGTATPLPCGNVTVYCPEGSSAPAVAAAGYYTAPESSAFAIVALVCPPGSYCSGGERRYCPAGTYQGGVLASNVANCSACLGGGIRCPPGTDSPKECGSDIYYCPLGGMDPLRAGAGNYTLGASGFKFAAAVCPLGAFCPGDGESYPCPPGRFGNVSGLSDGNCSGVCNDGALCLDGTRTPSGQPCPVGHFCAGGFSHPCPSGTFNPTFSATSVGQCLPCPAGKYNPSSGSSSDANCTACDRAEGSSAGAPTCWPGIVGVCALHSDVEFVRVVWDTTGQHASYRAGTDQPLPCRNVCACHVGCYVMVSNNVSVLCVPHASLSMNVVYGMNGRVFSPTTRGGELVVCMHFLSLHRVACIAASPYLLTIARGRPAAIVASDPEPLIPGLSADDELTVYWTKATNKPDVSTPQQLNALLRFTGASSPLVRRASWNGDGDLLVMILGQPSNSSTLLSELRMSVLPGGGLRAGAAGADSHNASIADVPLRGTWGNASQPRFLVDRSDSRAVIALDYGGQPGLGVGDAVLLRFNQPVKRVPVGSKAELDALLAWEPATWATNYTGMWLDDLNLLVTVREVVPGANDNATHRAATAVGALAVSVLASGNLTSFDKTSAPSNATAKVTGGSWGDVVCSGGVVVRSHTSLVVAFMPLVNASYVPTDYTIEVVAADDPANVQNVTVVVPGQSLSLPLPSSIPTTALRYSLPPLSTDMLYYTRVAAAPPTLPPEVSLLLNRTVPHVFTALGVPGEGCSCAAASCSAVPVQNVTAVAPRRPAIGVWGSLGCRHEFYESLPTVFLCPCDTCLCLPSLLGCRPCVHSLWGLAHCGWCRD
jgi:hypothetical protein